MMREKEMVQYPNWIISILLLSLILDHDSSIEEVDGSVVGLEALSSLRQSIVTRLQTPQTKKEENKVSRYSDKHDILTYI